MSTWLYLECLDHDPPITAAHESGQHLHDLPTIRRDIANRATIVAALNIDYGPTEDEYFRSRTAHFLAGHPTCRIGIRDEYGDTHPAIDPEEDQP